MTAKRTILVLALITLGSLESSRVWAQPKPPTMPPNSQTGQSETVYVVFSRSSPGKPWFNGARFSDETRAIAEMERLKKSGYQVFCLPEAPDGGPPGVTADGMFRVYIRSEPAEPWFAVGTFRTRAEANQRATAYSRMGHEVFIR